MNFEKQRSLNLLLLGLTYAFYYGSRYNLSSSHPVLQKILDWSYSDFSVITSTALLVYGLSVFFLGPVCDYIGGKKLLKFGLLGALTSNLLFGSLSFLVQSTHPLILKFGLNKPALTTIMAIIWSLNFFFQSCGAISVIKYNAGWYKSEERGKMAGIFGFYIQIGRALVLLFCPLILRFLPWQYAFYIPSLMLGIAYLIDSKFLYETPEELGFKNLGEEIKHVKIREVLKKIFSDKATLLIGSLVFFIASIRAGIEHYVARFFSGNYGIKGELLTYYWPYRIYSVLMPACMMISSLLTAYLCSRFFKMKRFPLVLLSLTSCLVLILCLFSFMSNPFLAAIFIALLMGAIQISNSTIMGMMIFDLGGRNMAASIGGFYDGLGYVGSSIIAVIMGVTLDHYKASGNEWKYWPLLMIGPCIVALIISTTFWNKKPRMINETKTI